jgi:uncharacterized repeat protein (TIGR03803 family)
VGGTLYGTTLGGGSGCGSSGCGTLFKLSTAGKETVLDRFKGGTDGANPEAGLIEMNGALYGVARDDFLLRYAELFDGRQVAFRRPLA